MPTSAARISVYVLRAVPEARSSGQSRTGMAVLRLLPDVGVVFWKLPLVTAQVLSPSWRILARLSSTPNALLSFPSLTRKM